jgi:hypothetical protein
LFAPIVMAPPQELALPKPTQPKLNTTEGVVNLAPAWLMQGLAWNGKTASAIIDTACAMPKKNTKTPAAKKVQSNRNHAKLTKKKPLCRAEKKRSSRPNDPANSKIMGDRRHKWLSKATFVPPALAVQLHYASISCLAQTC